jgi:hypothetical protein
MIETMNKEQFASKVDATFTQTEVLLIAYNILYNTEHQHYYLAFQLNDFDYCYNYLIENRHLLTIEHTPSGRKEMVMMQINSMLESKLSNW